jgi:hypothetical protein
VRLAPPSARSAPDSRRGEARAPFLLAALAATILLALATDNLWTHEGTPARYVAPSLPFLLALLGILIARARLGAVVVAGALVFVAAGAGLVAWVQRPALPASYWSPTTLVDFLDQRAGPDDTVVFLSPEQAGYYVVLSARPRRWALIPTGTDYLQGNAAANAATALAPLDSQTRRFWLVEYRPALGDGAAKVADWLSLNAFAATTVPLLDSEIAPYIGTSVPSPSRALAIQLVDGIALAGASFPSTLRPGGNLPVELDWTVGHTPSRDLTAFVHLVDARGKLWAQHDSQPENGRAPTILWRPGRRIADRHGLLVPSDLPAGDYWLEVGLYDGNGRLPLAAGGDTIRLGPVRAVS